MVEVDVPLSQRRTMVRDRGEKRGGLLGATSCPGLALAHCKLLFKLGDDSPKPFNEWLPGGVHKLLINLL